MHTWRLIQQSTTCRMRNDANSEQNLRLEFTWPIKTNKKTWETQDIWTDVQQSLPSILNHVFLELVNIPTLHTWIRINMWRGTMKLPKSFLNCTKLCKHELLLATISFSNTQVSRLHHLGQTGAQWNHKAARVKARMQPLTTATIAAVTGMKLQNIIPKVDSGGPIHERDIQIVRSKAERDTISNNRAWW